jgi:hypothetical protein
VIASDSVHLHAMMGQSYALDTVSNLGDTWTELSRLTNITGTLEFPISRSDSPRFFRGRLVQP